MVKLILTFLTGCIVHGVTGQAIQNALLSAGGESGHTGTISLDWSLGEVAVQSAAHGKLMYTEGFHQPVLIVQEIDARSAQLEQAGAQDISLKVYPNPANRMLNIERLSHTGLALSFTLIDVHGHAVLSCEMEPSAILKEVDVSDLIPGTYALVCSNRASGQQPQNYVITILK